MQWKDLPNAGFSAASEQRLVRPIVVEGPFAYPKVNVLAQKDVASSLLEQVRRMIRERRACPEIGWGESEVTETGQRDVLALCLSWQGNRVLSLHNLGPGEVDVRLELKDPPERVRLLIGDERATPVHGIGEPIHLDPYGFRWLKLIDRHRPLPV